MKIAKSLFVTLSVFFSTIVMSSCDQFTGISTKTQGVSNDEIVIGSHTALSGMAAYWGVGISNATNLVFDNINKSGGIHGRKIRYIVEDSHYNVSKAATKGSKLIDEDKIFLMLGSLGADQNNAVIGKQIEKNIPNLFPASYSESMVKPFHRLKFVLSSTYYDQTRAVTKFFVEKRGRRSVCTMYQESGFTKEILQGVRDQLKTMNLPSVAEISHSPNHIDFTNTLKSLRDKKCDVIIMGTMVRDSIAIFRTARKMGWDVDMVGSSASCEQAVVQLGGDLMESFFAISGIEVTEASSVYGKSKDFFDEYKAKYGKYPGQAALFGYMSANLTVKALQNAGRKLTVDTFIKGMESIKSYKSPFFGPTRSYSPKSHQGTNQSQLVQIRNGKWQSPINRPLVLTY